LSLAPPATRSGVRSKETMDHYQEREKRRPWPGSVGEGRRVKRRGPGPEASWDGGPTRPPCPFASGPYDSHHRRGCPDLLWAARWQVHRTVRDGWPWHGRTARMGLAIGSRPYAVERDPERDPPPVVESRVLVPRLSALTEHIACPLHRRPRAGAGRAWRSGWRRGRASRAPSPWAAH